MSHFLRSFHTFGPEIALNPHGLTLNLGRGFWGPRREGTIGKGFDNYFHQQQLNVIISHCKMPSTILNNCAYSLSFFLDYCTKPLWWPSLDMTMFLLKTAFTFTVSRHSLAHKVKVSLYLASTLLPCPCHCFLSFLKGGNCKVNFPPVTTTH